MYADDDRPPPTLRPLVTLSFAPELMFTIAVPPSLAMCSALLYEATPDVERVMVAVFPGVAQSVYCPPTLPPASIVDPDPSIVIEPEPSAPMSMKLFARMSPPASAFSVQPPGSCHGESRLILAVEASAMRTAPEFIFRVPPVLSRS